MLNKNTKGKKNEKDITNYKERDLIKYRRHDIGFVFQFYNLIQNLTALENVELAVQICKNYIQPKKILAEVGLEDRMNNFPSQLSAGEQQRVAIARAIAKKPIFFLIKHFTAKKARPFWQRIPGTN